METTIRRTRKGMEMGAGASSQGVLLGGDARYCFLLSC